MGRAYVRPSAKRSEQDLSAQPAGIELGGGDYLSARLLTTELFRRPSQDPKLTRAEALRQSSSAREVNELLLSCAHRFVFPGKPPRRPAGTLRERRSEARGLDG